MINGMATDPDIGTRIKKRRQALGIRTQQALADLLGVTRDTVTNWESGKHYPERHLGDLERVLGITLDDRPQVRPVDAHTRQLLRLAIPDDDDYRRVIGVLEGTVEIIEPPAEVDGRASGSLRLAT
jgi:transcriptional regulator with XRE-family HTH domain